MAIPSLPLDLVEDILDAIPEDIPSLKACAIVCRFWLPSSRRRLFRHMALDCQTDYKSLLSVLKTAPEIGRCVRDLEIHGDLGPCLWLADLARVIPKFTNIESLRLRKLIFQLLSSESLDLLLNSLAPVMETTRALSVEHVVFDKGIQIRDFIGAFTRVVDLTLVGCGCFRTNAGLPKPIERVKSQALCPKLRILRMSDCYREVSEALLQSTNLHLQHLTLHTSIINEEDPLLDADSSLFESLESLDLQSSLDEDEEVDHALYKFTTKLPILKFLAVNMKLADHSSLNVDWLYHTLDNLPFTILEVQLRVACNIRTMDCIEWNRIDDALGQRRFKYLGDVMVEFELWGAGMPEMQDTLIERLTKLRLFERGILNLKF